MSDIWIPNIDIMISQKGDVPKQEKDNIQKEDSSDISMRQSQKMSLINTFNNISSDHIGNTETIRPTSPSFPK
jgi:hypothetical protein